MRVLLVNPGMDLSKLGRFSGLIEPMPCIGLAYVAAALLKAGVVVRAVDMFAEHLDLDEVIERIRRFQPDVLGLSVMTPSAPICTAITLGARAALPELKVLWGGVHADVFASEIVAEGQADAVVHGEGEEAAVRIVTAWEAGNADLSGIPGVTWKRGDTSVTNASPELERDLDSRARPAWDLFPVHRYGLLPFADMARPVLTITASRGCPYHCDYCSLLHQNRHYRARDPHAVVDEYAWLVERYGVKQIGFVDPTFPLELDNFAVFADEMARRGLPERCVWLSETRADRLDDKICRLMYQSGCRRVLLGIESGSDLLLGNVHKRADKDRIRDGVRAARAAGIQTVGLFMIGLPGETPELTRKTVEFSLELGLDFAKFAMTVPFPGSKIFADLWETGFRRTDWENYTTFNPDPDQLVYHPEGYEPAELIRMQAWAHRRFYVRPEQIRRQLFELRTLTPANVLHGLYGAIRR
jgi:anaerobic magnesium-protoporphyrin IX monomethyl ester cyclase